MSVYIDLYVIVNIFFNFFILHITKIIIKSKSKNPRLLVASVTGAIYASLVFFPQTKYITGICGKIIFSLVLICISFKSKSFIEYIRTLVVFYSVCFSFGGIGFLVISFFGESERLNYAMLFSTTVVISYTLITLTSEIYERYFKYDKLFHNLKITLNERNIETKCIYDTGNSLKDPVTRLPVVVIDINEVKNILPDALSREIISGGDFVQIFLTFKTDFKLKLIPFKSVGGEGFLIGFRPDFISIDGKETNAVVGISEKEISSDKTYNAILNPQLIL